MRHSVLRSLYVLVFLTMLAVFAARTACAQSVWDKMKDAAKKASQQGQQPQQQPQPPKPGQKPPKQGQQTSGPAINDAAPFTPPAGTKIEPKVMAPLQEGGAFEISPSGVHVATTEAEGSRAVVYYDGVEGPKFDEILAQPANGRIVFSPDGNRYAYCARAGNQYVVMVDGKELVRSSESQSGGTINGSSCALGFTSNNKHVFYFSIGSTDTLTYRRFVYDGKPIGPPFSTDWDVRELAFSPDGEHYAFVWNDPRGQRPWMLIIDGKPAPYQGSAPVWTADSKHLYTEKGLGGGQGTELMFDGKPLTRAFNFRVYVPPVGDMVVVAVSGGVNFHPFSFLVVGGKKVPGSETVERGSIDNVVFSPDGKHYAAICGDITSHHYVIRDGKRGQEYVSVSNLAFTPDSSSLVYSSSVGSRTFVVIDDQEFGSSSGSGNLMVLPPAGHRVGAFMRVNGTPSLILDKKVAPLGERGGTDLSFSPDGNHYAYFAVDGLSGTLVVDGVPQAASVLSNDNIDLQNPRALRYIFSRDSKHVAHFGTSPPGRPLARGVFVDGKFIPTGVEGTNTQLAFSPDGNHIFWIHQYGTRPARLFIDGKPLIDFFGIGTSLGAPRWWEFGPDGTLSFLTQDDNTLKRITITLSSATSIANLTGAASALAGGNSSLASNP